MILVGFHGTSNENAIKIIESNKFTISQSETEWLGKGIYFYEEYRDAVEWTKLRKIENPVILCCLISVSQDNYIDFDTAEGKAIQKEFKKFMLDLGIVVESTLKNNCQLMNLIWKTNKDIKVMSASFYKERTQVKTLIEDRESRREFCVRDNTYIKQIVELEVFDA